MEVKSQKVNTFLFIILLASNLSFGAPSNTWVGSKYQIECTMCASCDNPCNQQPPPPPPPPPPPSTSTSGYYYSPPPPSTTTGGGGYLYSPPPPSQGGYFYQPPATYGNYPNPGPPNPVTNYFPYYYHNSPQYDSATLVSVSGAAGMLLINILFLF